MQKRLKVHTLIITLAVLSAMLYQVQTRLTLAMSLKSYLYELLHDQSLGLALLTQPTTPHMVQIDHKVRWTVLQARQALQEQPAVVNSCFRRAIRLLSSESGYLVIVSRVAAMVGLRAYMCTFFSD
jgi:hypothetical protein